MKAVNRFWTVFIPSALIFILFAIIFYLLVPLNVAHINSVTVKGTAQSGGIITYNVNYCQNVGGGIQREVHRFLEPKDTKDLNPIDLGDNPSIQTLQSSQGCHTGQDVKLPLDTSIPPGDYKLLVRIVYKFPLRDVTVDGESQYFTITKPDILGQLQSINNQLELIIPYVQQNPESVSTTESSSVSSVAPTIDTPQPTQTSQDSTVERDKNILQATVDSINGLLKVK